jgi:hypothetical protein
MRLSNLTALLLLLPLLPACAEPANPCSPSPDLDPSACVIAPSELHISRKELYGLFEGEAYFAEDKARNRCIRLMVEWNLEAAPQPALDTGILVADGRALKQMDITDDVRDCGSAEGDVHTPALHYAEQPGAAFGRIERSSDKADVVSLHVTLVFTDNGVIPQQSVTLDADNLELTK